MNSRLVQLLIVFVIFFVLTSPDIAGTEAREFFGWLLDGIQALGVFFEGLFSESSTPDPSLPADPTAPADPAPPADPTVPADPTAPPSP